MSIEHPRKNPLEKKNGDEELQIPAEASQETKNEGHNHPRKNPLERNNGDEELQIPVEVSRESKDEKLHVQEETSQEGQEDKKEGHSVPEESGLEAEARKVRELGVLDFEAKRIAAEDRAQAEVLLTRMKDSAAERTLSTHEMLARAEESARTELDHMTGMRQGGDRLKSVESDYALAQEEWTKAAQALEEYEETKARPTAEKLAKEEDFIVHEDHEGKEKRGLAAWAAGPLGPLVRLLPSSFFRRGSTYRSANPHNQ